MIVTIIKNIDDYMIVTIITNIDDYPQQAIIHLNIAASQEEP